MTRVAVSRASTENGATGARTAGARSGRVEFTAVAPHPSVMTATGSTENCVKRREVAQR